MAREPRKRPTINDVARLAGVSKKTVSRVINDSPLVRDDTRKAVKAVISETGYTPDPQARGLAFRRSFLIGLVFDSDNPEPAILQGLLDALAGSGFELVVRQAQPSSPRLLDDMRAFVERQKLFAVVLPAPFSEDKALVELLTSMGCRHIQVGSSPAAELRERARKAGELAISALSDLGA